MNRSEPASRYAGARNRAIVLAAPLLVAFLVSVGCATTGAPVNDDNITQRVEQATTASDHFSLASYFDEQAEAAMHKKEQLRQLRRRYERKPASVYYPTGIVPGILAHFDNVIDGQQKMADDYRVLAQTHRAMAASPTTHLRDVK